MTVRDRSLITWGRILAGASVLLSVGALLAVLIADPRLLRDDFLLNLLGVLGAGLGVVTWVTIASQPRNGAVWALVVSGFSASIFVVGQLTATLLIRRSMPGFSFTDPGDLTTSALSTTEQWAAYPVAWAWPVAFFSWLTLGLMLFPDGHAPSRRWRLLGWFNVIVITLVSAANAWLFRPGSTLPFATPLESLPGIAGGIAAVGVYLLPLGALMSVVALITRYRRSAGVERRQIRWIAWGGASAVLAIAGAFAAAFIIEGNLDAPNTVVDEALFLGGEVLFILSFAVAITKYRLYDIDIVISRTVAYVSLALVIAALYVAAVFGLAALFGDPDQGIADLGAEFWFGATALVAIVFEPIRLRLQRLANRMVYGQRAAPYEVLSQLTSELSDTSRGEGLVGLAELLCEGTGADGATVWLRVGDRLRVEATAPSDTLARPSDGVAEWDLPASELELSVPVRHSGELLGALGITKPRAHPVAPADKTLLTDVAAGAGLVLRNMRLNAELATRAAELRASRRRLIAAHDAARHRLERDLHDGAQQQVVALKVRLGVAQTIAEREGAHDLAVRVADLADGTQHAVDAMRAVARGIYPPLLDSEGLGPALGTVHRSVGLPLEIDLGTLSRYSRAVEEAAYFCTLAALNQAKMAGATTASLDVQGDDDSLTVTVSYDSATVPRDLAALADRVDAFGGTVTTQTAAKETTLTLALPVTARVMEPA